jgi:hypothetical protein
MARQPTFTSAGIDGRAPTIKKKGVNDFTVMKVRGTRAAHTHTYLFHLERPARIASLLATTKSSHLSLTRATNDATRKRTHAFVLDPTCIPHA